MHPIIHAVHIGGQDGWTRINGPCIGIGHDIAFVHRDTATGPRCMHKYYEYDSCFVLVFAKEEMSPTQIDKWLCFFKTISLNLIFNFETQFFLTINFIWLMVLPPPRL